MPAKKSSKKKAAVVEDAENEEANHQSRRPFAVIFEECLISKDISSNDTSDNNNDSNSKNPNSTSFQSQATNAPTLSLKQYKQITNLLRIRNDSLYDSLIADLIIEFLQFCKFALNLTAQQTSHIYSTVLQPFLYDIANTANATLGSLFKQFSDSLLLQILHNHDKELFQIIVNNNNSNGDDGGKNAANDVDVEANSNSNSVDNMQATKQRNEFCVKTIVDFFTDKIFNHFALYRSALFHQNPSNVHFFAHFKKQFHACDIIEFVHSQSPRTLQNMHETDADTNDTNDTNTLNNNVFYKIEEITDNHIVMVVAVDYICAADAAAAAAVETNASINADTTDTEVKKTDARTDAETEHVIQSENEAVPEETDAANNIKMVDRYYISKYQTKFLRLVSKHCEMTSSVNAVAVSESHDLHQLRNDNDTDDNHINSDSAAGAGVVAANEEPTTTKTKQRQPEREPQPTATAPTSLLDLIIESKVTQMLKKP